MSYNKFNIVIKILIIIHKKHQKFITMAQWKRIFGEEEEEEDYCWLVMIDDELLIMIDWLDDDDVQGNMSFFGDLYY